MSSCKSKPWSVCCRQAKDDYVDLAMRILDRLPEVLSTATPEDQAMRHLNDWLPVLHDVDNLKAVQEGTPLCAAYNKGLTSSLLNAANAGKSNAVPLLADIFRCCPPLVSSQEASDILKHICSCDNVQQVSKPVPDMLLDTLGNVHTTAC